MLKTSELLNHKHTPKIEESMELSLEDVLRVIEEKLKTDIQLTEQKREGRFLLQK